MPGAPSWSRNRPTCPAGPSMRSGPMMRVRRSPQDPWHRPPPPWYPPAQVAVLPNLQSLPPGAGPPPPPCPAPRRTPLLLPLAALAALAVPVAALAVPVAASSLAACCSCCAGGFLAAVFSSATTAAASLPPFPPLFPCPLFPFPASPLPFTARPLFPFPLFPFPASPLPFAARPPLLLHRRSLLVAANKAGPRFAAGVGGPAIGGPSYATIPINPATAAAAILPPTSCHRRRRHLAGPLCHLIPTHRGAMGE
jgi:hypothetical protein